ncbi:hypothetical protein D3870_20910 [Noviherbaspirillum cavernae]|uniref:Uncharacterized protein n=1 Tax=Noviherbaspirillum cavernae TaxID=2320862 RepID=A0A418WVX0_9BURK|nr:type III secretion system chaperone [Noviherbaspirillum cavernae]RJF96846.1 hypothetical protein D3870_20910 [Noviherbaspirillum cavernae]
MHDICKLDTLFAELGTRYGIANLRLPPHGAVGLRLKDGTELHLEYEKARGTLYAYCNVLPIPGDDASRLKLFAHMLELNFLDSGIDNGALSMQKDMAVCHVRFRIADVPFDAFDRALQKLLTRRLDIAKQLRAGMTSDTPKAARASRSTFTLMTALRQES